jgi:hypothetical protein
MTPVRDVALVGLGAIGILYAGKISAREPACLRIVADAARLARYRADPPALNGRRLDLNYRTPENFGPPADLVLVAVKSTGLAAALPILAPLLGPHTQILPLNGITPRVSEARCARAMRFTARSIAGTPRPNADRSSSAKRQRPRPAVQAVASHSARTPRAPTCARQ